jgi:prepilin-type processing-associated H-X9-DG protein
VDDRDILFCSYGYNVYGVQSVGNRTNALGLHGTFFPDVHGYAPVKESEVAVPADMMAIGDSLVGGIIFFRRPSLATNGGATARHQGRVNVVFCDSHVESPTLKLLFAETNNAALVRWNRDHQPHPDQL